MPTSKPPVLHILHADDHALFRDAIATWLERLAEAVRITAVADLEAVLGALDREPAVDLVLIDLGMPGMDDIDGVRRVCERCRGRAPVVIVSADGESGTIHACLEAGAAGYIPKSVQGRDMIATLRRLLPTGRFGVETTLAALNDKQRRILGLLRDGATNREIADRLSLSEGTVKQYVSQILAILGVDNRTQAGIRARSLLDD